MERLQKVRGAVYTRARAARAWVSRWVGPGFPPRGQVGGRWCHLVAARRAPPRGPRGLGSLLCPSPPSFGRSCAFGAACPRPSPARTFPRPPSHSPQQPLTSPGSVSSSRGSSVPGSPSSIVVSLPPPPRAPSGWEEREGWDILAPGRLLSDTPHVVLLQLVGRMNPQIQRFPHSRFPGLVLSRCTQVTF